MFLAFFLGFWNSLFQGFRVDFVLKLKCVKIQVQKKDKSSDYLFNSAIFI